MGCPTQVTFARTALAGRDSCEIGWLLRVQINMAVGKNRLRFNVHGLVITLFPRKLRTGSTVIQSFLPLEKAESYHLTTYIFCQKVTQQPFLFHATKNDRWYHTSSRPLNINAHQMDMTPSMKVRKFFFSTALL